MSTIPVFSIDSLRKIKVKGKLIDNPNLVDATVCLPNGSYVNVVFKIERKTVKTRTGRYKSHVLVIVGNKAFNIDIAWQDGKFYIESSFDELKDNLRVFNNGGNVSITKIVSDIEQEINTRGTKIAQAFN